MEIFKLPVGNFEITGWNLPVLTKKTVTTLLLKQVTEPEPKKTISIAIT